MILVGENRNAWRKTCFSATLFTINPIRTGVEWTPAVRVGKPAASRPSHCTCPLLTVCRRQSDFTVRTTALQVLLQGLMAPDRLEHLRMVM